MIRLKSKQRKRPSVQIRVSPGGITGIDLITGRPGSMIEQDRLFGFYLHLLDGVDLLEKGTRDYQRRQQLRKENQQ